MARRDHPELRFEVGSLAALPYGDGQFAGVVLWCVALALALVGPLLGRLLWRRRSRATTADVTVLRGGHR